MIKGVNEFHLNEATVAQAIEDYINGTIFEVQNHIAVSSVRTQSNANGRDFVVIVRPKGGL